MKKEYNFSKAEKGKFYRPENEIEIPIYLDKKVKEYYQSLSENKNVDLNRIINSILEKEMEIQKKLGVK
jgi:hypothetical protein